MANDTLRFKKPGEDITAKASAGITGKRLVTISGNRTGGGAGGLSTDLVNVYQVAHAAANGAAIGVAGHDAASGSLVKVLTAGVVPVTADGSITAGDQIMVGATGKAKTYAAPTTTTATALPVVVVVGVALTGATDGADAEILLTIG